MKFKHLLSAGLVVGLSSAIAGNAMASGFQVWEQNAAGTADYHAGGAAEADNATTTYYNPAGLVRLQRPEVAMGMAMVTTDIEYDGDVNASSITSNPDLGYVRAQAGTFNAIPNFNFSYPINKRLVIGFGIVAPFGMQTNYGADTNLRFAATKTSMKTINIGPSLGWALTDKFSLGAGIDAQYMHAEFDEYAGVAAVGAADTESENYGSDWALAWHVGALYQFTPHMRLGLTYHAKVVHDVSGASVFTGPLAGPDISNQSNHLRSGNFKSTLIIPAMTSLSIYQDINHAWSWMATLDYTQWGAFNNLRLQNVAGLDQDYNTAVIEVTTPQHMRNTWNFALGAHYKFTSKWMWKFGGGFDQAPVSTKYRTVQLPDGDRIALATGFHYQATKGLGLDAGWTHLFIKKVRINDTQVVGPETTVTDGYVTSNADVFGLQAVYKF